ncbi:MAG: amino acid ABC transporter permease [bacterium]
MIIQIVALIAILLFFGYMVRNAIVNLEAIGKGFSFGFLWQPASYDINQSFIEYNSRSPHIRATVVGILNTLAIAVAGVILATIVGFLLGVMRLSKNYLTAKISYVYIEYVRNVPVLVHILMVHGILVQVLPHPRDAASIGDSLFLSNRGAQVPKPLFEPLFWIVLAVFVVGAIFTWWFRRYAKDLQNRTGRALPVFSVGLGAVIGAPLLMYFILGSPIVWEIPELRGFNFQGGYALRPEFIALWLALSLYTAAFIGEIVRAGILAVDYGQTEASAAVGLSRSRTLNLVVIPQALRVIVPPLTSQYLNLTKNSSLAIAIGYMDIVATIGGISLNQTGREMECMIIVLMLYLSISLSISAFMNWYNKRIKLVER